MPINTQLISEELRRRSDRLRTDRATRQAAARQRAGLPALPGDEAALAPAGSQITTTSFTPTGTMPARPTIPKFETPTLDRRRVRAETQREAAPQVRRLRDVTARALGAQFENPNVRRMTVREALQGFGSGLSSILTGARRTALQTELPEFQAQVGAAQRTFEANVQGLMNEYQALWNNFLRTGTTTQTTRRVT